MPLEGRGRRLKGQKRGSTSHPGPCVDAGASVIAKPPRAPDSPAEQLEITQVHDCDEKMIDVNSAPNKI